MIIKIRNGIIKITSRLICQYVLASYLQSGHELLAAHERRVGDPWCNLLTLCSDAGGVFKTSQSLNRWPMNPAPFSLLWTTECDVRLLGHTGCFSNGRLRPTEAASFLVQFFRVL